MNRRGHVGALLMVVAFSSACVEDPEEVVTSPEEPVSDDTVFHEVSITVREDGLDISEPRPITAGEQRAHNERKAAFARGETVPLAITHDSSCAYSSFWYFDRTDYTGNKICFTGAGSVELDAYYRYLPIANMYVNWLIARGSFYAGSQSGGLFTEAAIRSSERCGFNGAFWVPCNHVRPKCTVWGDPCFYDFAAYEAGSFDLTGTWSLIWLD